MEHAPLRPVPVRPAGPIDPATAVREMGAWLPTLPPIGARALALVVLAERPRVKVAEALGVSEPELGELLASARKELRQTIVVLGGSGWCERAEGLISDRLDGALAERDDRRLDVHLRNCSRCVEHERRLVQATDALVGGVGGGAARGPAPAGEAPPLVEAPPPDEELAPPAPAASPPGRASAETVGAPAEPASAEPAAAPSRSGDEIEAATEVLVARRTRGQIAAALAWNSLIGIAILLTLATIALTIAGILGAQL
jgi:Putative zinc-finger